MNGHRAHLIDPRSVVPESIMPPYAFLAEKDPYTGDMRRTAFGRCRGSACRHQGSLAAANEDLKAQVDPAAGVDLQKRYPKAQVRDFDGDPDRLTEMDAVVAYLQMLGTLVDVEKAGPQEQAHSAETPKGKAP